MVVQFPVACQLTGTQSAIGATLGEAHSRTLHQVIRGRPYGHGPGAIVLLDFSGVELATASYLKALLLPVLAPTQADQLLGARRGLPRIERAVSSATTDVYPMVANVSGEIREELEEVLWRRSLPLFEARSWSEQRVRQARLIGRLEGVLRETLEILLHEGAATAKQLHERHPADRISVTGWNNRLADLYLLRLVTRVKYSREWVYSPVVEGLVDG